MADFGQALTQIAEDPENLKFFGQVGSALSQGKGAGEALDPSQMIANKQAREQRLKTNIAAGKLTSGAIQQAGTDVKITPTRALGEGVAQEPGVVTPTIGAPGEGADLVPNVTQIGTAGPDQTTHVIKPDGTQNITAKVLPSATLSPDTDVAPASQAGAALGGEPTVAPQVPAPISQVPTTAPISTAPAQIGDALAPEAPFNPYEFLDPAQQQSILAGIQNMRTQKAADAVRNYKAAVLGRKEFTADARIKQQITDPQGNLVTTADLGAAPVAAGAGGRAPKFENWYNPTTKEWEQRVAGSAAAGGVTPGFVPADVAPSFKDDITASTKASNLVQEVTSGKSLDGKTALTAEAMISKIDAHNTLGADKVLVVKKNPDFKEDPFGPDFVYDFFGTRGKPYKVQLADNTDENREMAAENRRILQGEVDDSKDLGPQLTPSPEEVRGTTIESPYGTPAGKSFTPLTDSDVNAAVRAGAKLFNQKSTGRTVIVHADGRKEYAN